MSTPERKVVVVTSTELTTIFHGAFTEPLYNDRYPDIRWTGADDVIRRGFTESTKAHPA